MIVTVRDLNYYQESEYLGLTITSWKVGFLAQFVVLPGCRSGWAV